VGRQTDIARVADDDSGRPSREGGYDVRRRCRNYELVALSIEGEDCGPRQRCSYVKAGLAFRVW
jgi:hypothetical protein